MSENKNYWLKSGALTLLEKGSQLIFSLGTAVLLFRGLSKAEYTGWGVFLIITLFLEMGRSGLIQNGLMRFLSVNAAQEEEYKKIATASLALNVLYSLVSLFLLWLAAAWLAKTYNAPQLLEILPIYYLTNVVMVFMYHCNFIQQANLEFRGIFFSTFFYRGMLFLWVLVAVFSGHGLVLKELAFSMLVGAILGTVGSWYFARPFLRHSAEISKKWIFELVKYGKYVLGTNLSTMFYKNIDKLTLSSLLGTDAFAIYDAAAKVTQMVETPSFSMAAIVFPQSARRIEEEGPAGAKWLYERSVGAILAMITPFLILTVIFAKPIVLLLAGAGYADSANVLRLTALFGLFMPYAVQFGTILDSTGKPNVNFWYTFLTAVLNLGFSYICVTKWGLFGAAIGTLIGYSISFVLMQLYLNKAFRINPLNPWKHVPSFYKMGFEIVGRLIARKN